MADSSSDSVDYVRDVENLLSDFLQSGDSSFRAFKELWRRRSFSFIHEGCPAHMEYRRYLQILFATAQEFIVNDLKQASFDPDSAPMSSHGADVSSIPTPHSTHPSRSGIPSSGSSVPPITPQPPTFEPSCFAASNPPLSSPFAPATAAVASAVGFCVDSQAVPSAGMAERPAVPPPPSPESPHAAGVGEGPLPSAAVASAGGLPPQEALPAGDGAAAAATGLTFLPPSSTAPEAAPPTTDHHHAGNPGGLQVAQGEVQVWDPMGGVRAAEEAAEDLGGSADSSEAGTLPPLPEHDEGSAPVIDFDIVEGFDVGVEGMEEGAAPMGMEASPLVAPPPAAAAAAAGAEEGVAGQRADSGQEPRGTGVAMEGNNAEGFGRLSELGDSGSGGGSRHAETAPGGPMLRLVGEGQAATAAADRATAAAGGASAGEAEAGASFMGGAGAAGATEGRHREAGGRAVTGEGAEGVLGTELLPAEPSGAEALPGVGPAVELSAAVLVPTQEGAATAPAEANQAGAAAENGHGVWGLDEEGGGAHVGDSRPLWPHQLRCIAGGLFALLCLFETQPPTPAPRTLIYVPLKTLRVLVCFAGQAPLLPAVQREPLAVLRWMLRLQALVFGAVPFDAGVGGAQQEAQREGKRALLDAQLEVMKDKLLSRMQLRPHIKAKPEVDLDLSRVDAVCEAYDACVRRLVQNGVMKEDRPLAVKGEWQEVFAPFKAVQKDAEEAWYRS